MVVIYSHALTNTTSVFISSTLLKVHQNSITKLTLVKLDVFNGLMMTQASSLEVGMAVYSCGSCMQTRTQEEMVNKRMVTQSLNSSLRM
jgi:hypothetical protein